MSSRFADRYELREVVGIGGMSEVHLASDLLLKRDVAVKVIHERLAADPGFVRRFDRDAQVVAAIEHPHIVPVYDHWREPGNAYVVTRYLRGGSFEGPPADRADAIRNVWIGVGIAIAICLGVGILLQMLRSGLPQQQQEMPECVVAGIAVGVSGVIWPQRSVVEEMIAQGFPGGILLIALTGLLTWLCFLTMTALPEMLAFRTKVAASR